MAKADYYTVLESFTVNLDGTQLDYLRGEIVDATDPIFRKSPHLFGPIVVRGAPTAERVVEQATAGPGEVRDLPKGRAVSLGSMKGRG